MSDCSLIALGVAAVVLGFPIWWLALAYVVRRFVHFPAPAFIGRFLDSGFRRKFQPPDKLVSRSGFEPGMRVLEVGCGSGAYTTFVARAVGKHGKVYALDIQPDMLAQLERKLAKPENADITNIELVQASAYELPFEDSSLDAVYMITVLQEIPDRHRALLECYRVLKPGGILALSEFLIDPDSPSRAKTVKQARTAGFVLDAVEGGRSNYTARFVKPA